MRALACRRQHTNHRPESRSSETDKLLCNSTSEALFRVFTQIVVNRTLRTVPVRPEPFPSTLLAGQPGFSLHAATVCEAAQRDKFEKLCHHIARPAIANERLSTNDRGQVVYRFKQPFRDGSTHVVLDPLDFIARPAALVPRPRLNLTRFHGVFAPNCKHRESVVPKRKPRHEKPDKPLAPDAAPETRLRHRHRDPPQVRRQTSMSVPTKYNTATRSLATIL